MRSQSREEAVLTVTEELTVSTQAEETVLTVNCNSSTVSTCKRKRGEGTGRIQWRTFTKKNGKQYQQPWYDWQIHQGEKTISRSTYIPKRLLFIIQELEDMKAPVREILIELEIIK
ncbi:MAG: hypothetical protein C6Y22_29385 [Hapalosiphonaceae cyanobacterium JJU2]|nr:MAG: hypothetical protein C6Y22_29385 [Hapalosiphonaceae cyanobacterium JJU2]